MYRNRPLYRSIFMNVLTREGKKKMSRDDGDEINFFLGTCS